MKKNERVCSQEVGEKTAKRLEVTVNLRKGEMPLRYKKQRIEGQEKKFKGYDLKSKEKVQQISNYDKQKQESKSESKLYYRQRERWSECQPYYKPNTKANKEGK